MGGSVSKGRMLMGAGLLAVTALAHAAADDATPKGLSPREYNVFVASEHQSRITMIDPDLLEIVGAIDLGFEVKQLAVSARLKAVAAIDGRSPEVRIYDLTTDKLRSIPLPFMPTRLVRAPDDTRLAILDDLHSRLAIVDLERRNVVITSSMNGAFENVLFSTDGGALYLAGRDEPGVTVIDIDGGSIHKLTGSGQAAFTGLSRSPNGRDGFGKRQDSNELEEFDLRRQAVAGHLDVTLDTSFAYVTGTGRFVLLPDNRRRELRVATTDPLEIVATLQGSSAMDAAYSAWFDTLAYVTSPAEHRLLVYDLDRFSALGEIRLRGTPGPAVVGPGGDKLFVPLVDAKAVQVIDVAHQRVTADIHLDANPTALVLAGGYGICH
jgi:DNA-binding beta-propeller fold protein YncE